MRRARYLVSEEAQLRWAALCTPAIPGVRADLVEASASAWGEIESESGGKSEGKSEGKGEAVLGDVDRGLCLIVRAEMPLATLSSAVIGGGFAEAAVIVNRQVTKGYMADDPEEEMCGFMARLGLPGDAALGLMTAAFVRDVGFAEHAIGQEGHNVATWATVGLGNAARAGRERVPAGGLFPGTINVITVVDGDLAPAAFVGAAVVAAEAKAAALLALGVRDADDGGVATGTTTDAVVIAATRRGRAVRYAGTATVVGHAIARTVYDAVLDAGRRYQDYVALRATGM
jgi:adenosylcobinamide hydrolase